ncbi:RNA-dependent RNA polymerase [Aspergillus ellipticus fusarivirus 1]|uniref:RNA-dependent RNA polymerase n=1 Tax=Aspergillus ellipticus fusarivirus 1 TaxID=2501216 RepID=A0AAD2JFS0_9VIRU|nr:RNA-dependent RNA polymerase [Aspergillus ellipticus fusarivirus 1]AZT88650.1 RNA-dependent RNA polymerase [Aspergillus ellipticus fusarivirus 1]
MFKRSLNFLILFVLQLQLLLLLLGVSAIGPLFMFSFVWTGHFLAGPVFYFCVPFALALLPCFVHLYCVAELDLAGQVGADHVLWSNCSSPLLVRLLPFRQRCEHLYFEGWDAFQADFNSIPLLGQWLAAYGTVGPESARVVASRAYIDFVRKVHWATRPRHLYLFWLLAVSVMFGRLRSFLRVAYKLYLPLLAISIVAVAELPTAEVYDILTLVVSIIASVFWWTPRNGWLFGRYLKLKVLSLIVDVTLWANSFNFYMQSQYSERLSGRLNRANVFKETIMHSVNFVDSLRLPAYIKTGFRLEPTLQALKESRELLAELGWPVTVELTPPDMDATANTRRFKDWLIAGTDFATGIRQLEEKIDSDLVHLKAHAEVFRRSESYQSKEAELEATSRYFSRPTYVYPGLPEDEVWYILRDIFSHSQLTPFWWIIKNWEKRYALGFWMKDDKGRKYKRSKFISSVGYPKFKEMWATLFYWAPAVVPVSHVSVKGEALPEKKWSEGKVRSIIGSPLASYISSTVWNYFPNHRFAWESTPVKIGMPLNGYWLTKVFAKHSKFEHHCEGDMTAFDSTIQGPVVDVIKAVRKRGFDHHKDKDAIGDLIDVAYKQLDAQANGFTSTGNIFAKGTGLSTGHSSTSMDNSVALVVLYLMAWKELTGLTSREFKAFNELSCYGDDHLLSYSAVRPLGWTAKNIEKTMARWGVTNRISTKPIQDLTFLSKKCRRPNLTERSEFEAAGLMVPEYIVYHDRKKLVGKLVAPVLNTQTNYRLKRVLSYLSLTAHHKDVYDDIVAAIHGSKSLTAELKSSGKKIPSYRSVLLAWYSSKHKKQIAEVQEEVSLVEDSTNLVTWGNVTLLDDLLNALSLVPDFVNPQMFNLGYMNVLQRRLGQSVKWPMVLMAKANAAFTLGSLASVVQRSPYRFLDTSSQFGILPDCNASTLLVRHWLFLAYSRWAPFNVSASMFAFVANKLSNLNFVVNAHLMENLQPFNMSVDKLIVVSILDYITVPDWFSAVHGVRLPDIALMLDLLFNKVMSTIWSSVPSNYNEVGQILRTSPPHAKVLVTAPTGTGKSTSLIAYLCQVFGGDYSRIIVVEPRTLLVHGLVRYMSEEYGPMYSGSTTGLQLDERCKVWYMTPESLFARNFKVPEGSLLVLDEAHLPQESYALLLELGHRIFSRMVSVTATPSAPLLAWCDLHTAVPIASLWSRKDQTVPLTASTIREATSEYEARMVDLVRTWPPNKRLLVVVDAPSTAERLAAVCPHPSQCLSSEHSPIIDRSARCYFGTSVVDVGVTIPDLDQIHFPNWAYQGRDRGHLALDAMTEKQRRGRVGRTKNGDTVMWVAPLSLPPQPETAKLDVDCLQRFMLQGVSPLFLAKANIRQTVEALGANMAMLDKEDTQFLLRDAHVFLANLAPLMVASRVRPHDQSVIHGGAGQLAVESPLSDSELTNVVKSGLHFIVDSFDAASHVVSARDKSLMEDCIVDASSRAGTRFNIGWLLDHLAEAESESDSDSEGSHSSDGGSESEDEGSDRDDSEEEELDLLNPEGASPLDVFEYARIVRLIMSI